MSRKKTITIKWILIGFLLVTACNDRPRYAYQAFKTFEGNVWNRHEEVKFHYTPAISGKKNIYFYLENTQQYPYSNLFLITKTVYHNKTIVDTLEYQMTDGRGRWLGRKVRNTFENLLIFKRAMPMDQGKEITIEVEPATRKIDKLEGDKNLPGIVRFGIIIENVEEKNQ